MIAPPIKIVPANKLPGNARHNFGRIKISEAAPMKAAILAQEVAEWQMLRRIQLLWTLAGLGIGAIAFLSAGWPVLAMGGVTGLFIGGMVAREKATKRRMEFFGHAVEVAAAVRLYGADEGEVRHEEARALALAPGYQKFMKGWTVEQVEEELIKNAPAARAWVTRNAAALERWKERNG